MKRLLAFSILAMCAAVPARAVEMFTNFHNGENIGFPPMQVPVAIYGRGGWNCAAMQDPAFRTVDPVPAMSPTGSYQPACERRCGSASAAYVDYYAGDRWHGRPRGFGRSNLEVVPAQKAAGEADVPQSGNVRENDNPGLESAPERNDAPAVSEPASKPVWLNAQPGIAPENEKTQAPQSSPDASAAAKTSGKTASALSVESSARRDTANWSRGEIIASDKS